MNSTPVRFPGRAKELLRATLPLSMRQRMAVWIGRQAWLSPRHWWSAEMVRDLAERDVGAYHSFLWANHLAYAATYEVPERFGAERIHPSRHLLFTGLEQCLRDRGVDPARDIRSVFEVGCSMGYLLRYLETELFPAARCLDGVDIDGYAVGRGMEHLRAQGSRVRLVRGDMRDLPCILAGKEYDVILCAGVLMYLPEAEARTVVAAMLRHCGGVVALAGLAHPEVDNARLGRPVPRAHDRALIHNLDRMVAEAGGTVVCRRWEGPRVVEGNTIYFVFAAPAAAA